MPPPGFAELGANDPPAVLGERLHGIVRDLYPICRSITGNGVRQTLERLSEVVAIDGHEVPSGTRVFDWVVPDEWNIRDAWVKNAQGERIIDFRRHNLHVLGYSEPIRRRVSRAELLEHLYSLPEQPDLIPYRTSYYTRRWGFCAPHTLLAQLTDDEYDVCIDSTLEPGSLTYGEVVVPGRLDREVLLSSHICHPSLCNDNLSSLAIAATLARQLQHRSLRYTYRFLFSPGTIGAITWLALNEPATSRIEHGLVLACLGDGGPFTYKRSRRENARIDQIVEHVIAHGGGRWQVRGFSPHGYDERQYCSPGFNLPVGRLSRSPHGEFPEYHTSADDLCLVTAEALAESYATLLAVVDVLESDRRYINVLPKCEPQLGPRGLYAGIGGTANGSREMALLWTLNLSDGEHTLFDIARRANLPFHAINDAAQRLEAQGLLTP